MATPDSTRETRAFARELKFLAPVADAPRLRAWMRNTLQPDPHGTGPHRDEYDITTLYLDTDGLDVFNRRRSFGRAKLRVRRYGRSPIAFLERKLRTDGLLAKRRTPVALAELARLNEPLDKTWTGHWFLKRLRKRSLAPATLMTYHRIARSMQTPTGYARVTMDVDLRVQAAHGFTLSQPPGQLVISDHVILEVKFQGPLPALIETLRTEFSLEPQSVSKYRLGAATLGAVAEHEIQHEASPLFSMGDPS